MRHWLRRQNPLPPQRETSMHELSIAMSIIDGAAEEAARHGFNQVKAVHLKLGPLAGVMKEALLFSYEIACAGTLLEGSRLLIEDAPVIGFCPMCRDQRAAESMQRFACADCGTLMPDIVSGRELLITALETEQ